MQIATTTVVKDKAPSLEDAQKCVGGYVEMVRATNGDQILANEEGLLLGLPVNHTASALAGRRIVGNVMVLTGKARWK